MLNNTVGNLPTPFKTCINNRTQLSPNTAKLVAESNDNRLYTLFQNPTSSIITIVLIGDLTKVEIGKGLILLPYGSFEINRLNLYTGKVHAICSNLTELIIIECSR